MAILNMGATPMVKVLSLNCSLYQVRVLSCSVVSNSFETPRTAAHQAPLSKRFSRQEYWSGLPCPSPGDLPNPGIKPRSFTLQVNSLPSEPPGKSLAEYKAQQTVQSSGSLISLCVCHKYRFLGHALRQMVSNGGILASTTPDSQQWPSRSQQLSSLKSC